MKFRYELNVSKVFYALGIMIGVLYLVEPNPGATIKWISIVFVFIGSFVRKAKPKENDE